MKKENQIVNIVKKIQIMHWQLINLALVAYDVMAVNAAYFLALWFRFDCSVSLIEPHFIKAYFQFVPIYTVVCIGVFALLKLYRSIWRFASYNELVRVIGSSAITAVFHTVAITLLFSRMPISYYIIGAVFQFVAVLAMRFSYRFVLLLRSTRDYDRRRGGSRVMLIGAGVAGQTILRDIQKAKEVRDHVICVIDDNPNKWGRYIEGVPIVGGRDDIAKCAKKYQIDKVYLAVPSASAEEKRQILEICKETDCELKNLPGMYQLLNGEVAVSKMKNVAIEDLLGREPITANLNGITDQIAGKTILVTGGGGSIGSELCRQIAERKPGMLVILDVYENSIYDIQLELMRKYPELPIKALIGSVRDSRRIDDIFRTYQPDIVYHAAAHKHVPLMEDSPNESIKNNVMGTYRTAYAAMVHGAEKFVLISTDKAVNPTNIMGASKRLCEMIIQTMDSMVKSGQAHLIPPLFVHSKRDDHELMVSEGMDVKTEFVAVRFGNVLGSNGSVIPLFKKQIEQGGPVTVTHPDIIRYFMTIPEAVSLVLLAGTYAGGGEIFVLDMGSPVKIDDLARNLIRLSGHKPDVDIKIMYTGLRPGEKLYEEKLMEEEGLKKTDNELIHIGQPIPMDTEKFLQNLGDLFTACYQNSEEIRRIVAEMVPTYQMKK